LNVHEESGGGEVLPSTGGGPRGITVRQLAVAASTAAIFGLVWRHTGGDFLLSAGAIPFVYSSLNRWIAH
jgi:hypothetical protein